MYSIVCPTMWRSRGLEMMVQQQKLLDHPFVKELLLIDNDPQKSIDLKHPKIRVVYRGSNIFVNPAWNLGVREAKSDWICLLSDDIIFDPSIFSQLKMSPTAGIVGPGEGCDIGVAGTIVSKKITVHPCLPQYRFYEEQFGTLMLFHKDAYLPIPEEAKIFLGDVWLFDWNHHRGARNYFMNNFDMIIQRGATSSSPDMQGLGMNELNNAKYFFEKYFPK